MDQYLTKLFNNGDNDGDVTIISKDGMNIKCHSLVVKYMSAYIASKSTQVISLDYNSKTIINGFNKLYYSGYTLSKLDAREIIDVVTFFDDLQILNIESTRKQMADLFFYKLNKDNWAELFNLVAEPEMYIELYEIMLDYYVFIVMYHKKPDELDLNPQAKKILVDFYNDFGDPRERLLPSQIESEKSWFTALKFDEIRFKHPHAERFYGIERIEPEWKRYKRD